MTFPSFCDIYFQIPEVLYEFETTITTAGDDVSAWCDAPCTLDTLSITFIGSNGVKDGPFPLSSGSDKKGGVTKATAAATYSPPPVSLTWEFVAVFNSTKVRRHGVFIYHWRLKITYI